MAISIGISPLLLAQTFGQWQNCVDFAGGPRDDGCAVAVGESGYYGLGSDFNFVLQKDWWLYDATANTWSRMADLPGDPMQYATAIGHSLNIYVIGGIKADGSYEQRMFVYNTVEDNWEIKEISAFEPRAKACGFRIGDELFFGLGRNDTLVYNDWWSFDLVSETWNDLKDPPLGPRFDAVSFSDHGFGYVLGGSDTSSASNDLWRYYPREDSWEMVSSFPGEASTFMAGVKTGNGYLIAGGDAGEYELSDQVWHLDIESLRWTALPDLNAPTRGMEGFALQQRVYLIGGIREAFTRTSETLCIDGDPGDLIGGMELSPNPARSHVYVSIQGSVLSGRLLLFDVSGKLVYTQEIITSDGAYPVDLSRFDSGIYFLQFQSDTFNATKKLVVQK